MRVSRVGYAAAKGTRHLAREHLGLAADGVVGDRRWCFVDVAARRVLRTVAHPGLVGLVLDEVGDDLVRTGVLRGDRHGRVVDGRHGHREVDAQHILQASATEPCGAA